MKNKILKNLFILANYLRKFLNCVLGLISALAQKALFALDDLRVRKFFADQIEKYSKQDDTTTDNQ